MKLKPCPFCGGGPELDTLQGYRNIATGNLENAIALYCTACSANITVCYADVPDIQPEHVAEMWNKRHAEVSIFKKGKTMEDLERLTLAAKAVGYQVCEPYRIGEFRVCLPGDDSSFPWDPLTNDGDALRLAISLNMGISIPCWTRPSVDVISFRDTGAHCVIENATDLNFATRNAIVNVAVQLAETAIVRAQEQLDISNKGLKDD